MANFTQNWMSYIDDKLKLSALTIPGTHDTGTSGLSGLHQCQSMTLEQQLDSGIRFLDIRLRLIGNRFEVWHGGSAFGKSAELEFEEDILKICKTFLKDHPSEVLVMSIKHELNGPSDNEKTTFLEKIFDIINNAGVFYTHDKIPSLQEVRGKIILFRRFWARATGYPTGMDLTYHWPKNSTEHWENPASKISYSVQDEYNSIPLESDIPRKFNNFVQPLLDESPNLGNRLIMNFTSGVISGGGVLWLTPKKVAKVTNQKLLQYIKNKKGRYGIIPMDFPEEPGGLIRELIKTNFNWFRNKDTGWIGLYFWGESHHVPDMNVAKALFGEKFENKIPNLDEQFPNEGVPLINGRIVKFDSNPALYLNYEISGEPRSVLRHISNPEVQARYGLNGEIVKLTDDGKGKFRLDTALT